MNRSSSIGFAVVIAAQLGIAPVLSVAAEEAPRTESESAQPTNASGSDPTAASVAAEADDAVESAADDASETDSAATVTPSAQEQHYLDELQQLEATGDAYDPRLEQQLLGLGRAYQQAGEHEQAIRVLSRAAHIARINSGLYSAADFQALLLLIESYAALGDWEQVDNRYHRLFESERKRHGEDSPELLPSLQALSSWHMKAFLASIGEEPSYHILAARSLYENTLRIMQKSWGANDPRLTDTLRDSALANFYLSQMQPEEGADFSFGRAGPQQAAVTPIYVLQSFSSGRDALQRIIEIRRQNPEDKPEARSQAIAELGDWNLLFRRPQSAYALYREAWESLAASGVPVEAVAAQFAEPVELPASRDRFLSGEGASAEPPGSASMKAVFVVNPRGRAEAITVEPTDPPPPKQQVYRLRRMIRGLLFRPKLLNGEAVVSDSMSYRYYYDPAQESS